MHKLIYLIFILSLSIACVAEKSKERTVSTFQLVSYLQSDSLTFTSGIRSIFQDSKGNYWFGSMQEGVCLFDGKTFTYFTTEDGLSHNQVLSIQEDENGHIWFGTQDGVSSFDGKKMASHVLNMFTDVNQPWMKREHDLWFNAGIQEGAYRYDGNQLRYLAFPSPQVINPNNLYAVTAISKGKNDMLWLGTYAGVFGYDGSDFTIINDETLGLDVETEPLHIRSLLADSQGRLWIGNNGIGVLLKERDTTINFSEKHNLIHLGSSRKGDPSPPGTLEHVFTIAEDSQGNIWFGDRDAGIWQYDGESMKNYTQQDGLSDDFAQAIYEDRQGKLWFGMGDGSVYTFDGEGFERPF